MQVVAKVSVDLGGIRSLKAGARARVADVVAVAAHRIEARAKVNIREVNAIDTGATMNTTQAKPVENTEKLVWTIGPATTYAIYIEMGTYKMAARPWLVPALEAEKSAFTAAVKYVVESGR